MSSIVQDLAQHCISKNTETCTRVFDLVSGDAGMECALAMAIGASTLRQCVSVMAHNSPLVAKQPEAVQMMVVASIMARTVGTKDYDRMQRMPQQLTTAIANEILALVAQGLRQEDFG